MTILFVFRALCLHCCRRQVLPCLGTLPSSPHRSHRRPLVVQSQLSSQPVAGCRLMLARSRMLERSLFALSMPVVCPCLSALNFPGNNVVIVVVEPSSPHNGHPKCCLKWSPQKRSTPFPTPTPSSRWQHFGSRVARVGMPNIPRTSCKNN